MLIDDALDRTIVLGYGRVGLLARRRLPGWPTDPPRIDGAAVLVTGRRRGSGSRRRADSRGWAPPSTRSPAIPLVPRKRLDGCKPPCPARYVRPQACDLSSLHAVSAFAARELRFDVLVNNAGVIPPERRRSVDGHELMFATHVLAPLALTMLLLPGRVINVSSGGMYSQSLPNDGDWESDRAPYSPKKLYARTKREEVVITEVLAERLRGRGVVVHAMHPGLADTEGQASDAFVSEGDPADHPQRRRGRGHDRVARRGARTRADDRPVLGTTAGPARRTTGSRTRATSARARNCGPIARQRYATPGSSR